MNTKQTRARKILRAFLVLSSIVLVLLIALFIYLHEDYPNVRDQARAEENVFWGLSNRLSQEDRSALVNYVTRTNTLPHVLPWWEHDRDMCSAVVVKYISLFTGIKFFHTGAWQFRSLRPCGNCVANERKLTSLWDATGEFDQNGNLPAGKKEAFVNQVLSLPFETDKVYVIGLLWEETKWWNKIREANRDVNSHVALYVKGKVIHFFHLNDEHPLRIETLQDVFARGNMKPVWVAEVHEKSRATAPDWILVKKEFRLVQTNRELAFEQNVWPWMSLRRYLRFPATPDFIPESWHDVSKKADTLIEKTLLMHHRNGFNPYPTRFREVKQCIQDVRACYSPASSSLFCAEASSSTQTLTTDGPFMLLRTVPCSENLKE